MHPKRSLKRLKTVWSDCKRFRRSVSHPCTCLLIPQYLLSGFIQDWCQHTLQRFTDSVLLVCSSDLHSPSAASFQKVRPTWSKAQIRANIWCNPRMPQRHWRHFQWRLFHKVTPNTSHSCPKFTPSTGTQATGANAIFLARSKGMSTTWSTPRQGSINYEADTTKIFHCDSCFEDDIHIYFSQWPLDKSACWVLFHYTMNTPKRDLRKIHIFSTPTNKKSTRGSK